MRAKTISLGLLILLANGLYTFGQRSSPFNRFAGHFVLVGATGDLRFDRHLANQPTLEIAEASRELQIKRSSSNGKQEEMDLPLDGRECQYMTSNGSTARATLKIRGKSLEITTDIPGKDYPRLPRYRIHSLEHWSLSGDSKTLKVCGYADSLGGVVQFRKSGCQIYKRQ